MAKPGPTTTLSTKGQVILPKTIRGQLHWHPGTRLSVEHTADGVLLKPLTTAFADPARERFQLPPLHGQAEDGGTDACRDRHRSQTVARTRSILTSSSAP